MILKNLDPQVAADARMAAGQQAEQEMAFYLRRTFQDNPDLRVFNGLRFQFGEDTAQIDHLVLHTWGVILVESKSVSTRVQVNAQEEWARWYDGHWEGMPSPLQQVRRQGEFLKHYLGAHAPQLLGKWLGLQRRFGSMTVDVLVAISDQGIIQRVGGRGAKALPEVVKADQVTDRVREIYERHREANSLKSLLLSDEGGYGWNKDEVARLQAFLLARHRPLMLPPPTSSPPGMPVPNLPSVAPSTDAKNVRPTGDSNSLQCAICRMAVSDKVAQYCRDHAARFGGRILCFNHQRSERSSSH